MSALQDPNRSGYRGAPQSASRVTVQRVLRESLSSVSHEQIAKLTGVTLAEARMHVSRLVGERLAHNTRPGVSPPLYAWGASPLAEVPRAPAAQAPRYVTGPAANLFERSTYCGAELRPYTGRPGAMDAYRLPSLVNGKAAPRVAPMLMGIKRTDPV